MFLKNLKMKKILFSVFVTVIFCPFVYSEPESPKNQDVNPIIERSSQTVMPAGGIESKVASQGVSFTNGVNVSSEPVKITVSDIDISVMKIKEEIGGMKNSITEIRNAVEKSGEGAITVNEKINNMESKITRLEESVSLLKENIAEVESLKGRISASDISHRQEISQMNEKLRKNIKDNEDETKVLFDDLYQLKEDLAAGRRPSFDSKKPLKEYIPYISIGVSVIAFIIALH